jgi:hypothetical protein
MTDPAAEWQRVAQELGKMRGVVEQLLDKHQDDGNGRCTSCTTAGYGTRNILWPCSIYRLATEARRLRDADI